MSSSAAKEAASGRIIKAYWVTIIGIVLYVVLDAIAQALPPHYSAISQAESDLAVGPYGYVMAINFVNRGILSLAFVYAFVKTLDLSGAARAPFHRGYLLIGIWGVGALLLAVFPTDVPATPATLHGVIHLFVGLIAFFAGALGTLLLSRHFGESSATKDAKRFALAVGWLSVLLLVGELIVQFALHFVSVDYFGLTERIFLGSVLLWIFLVSVYMVRHRDSIFSSLQTQPSAPDPGEVGKQELA